MAAEEEAEKEEEEVAEEFLTVLPRGKRQIGRRRICSLSSRRLPCIALGVPPRAPPRAPRTRWPSSRSPLPRANNTTSSRSQPRDRVNPLSLFGPFTGPFIWSVHFGPSVHSSVHSFGPFTPHHHPFYSALTRLYYYFIESPTTTAQRPHRTVCSKPRVQLSYAPVESIEWSINE